MQQSRLFLALPEYISTPDGMEIDQEGNLILSCPNFAQPETSGCVVKIGKDKKVTKWFDTPIHPKTGKARNMGIVFGPDGSLYLCDNQGWSGEEELAFQGRVLRVKADENGIQEWSVVADGMEHPNGAKIKDGYLYVTQSCMTKVKDPSGLLVSCVYRFGLEETNVHITNTLDDPHIFTTFLTRNPACQYGADGIEFGLDGNLYVGNFGDGAIHRVTFDGQGNAKENTVFAQDSSQLTSTDGICKDKNGDFYVADFSANAIAKVDHVTGRVTRLAQSPDCTGLEGGLDQPGEPIIWEGKIIASCFDLVTDEGKVNTAHEMPATMAELDIL